MNAILDALEQEIAETRQQYDAIDEWLFKVQADYDVEWAKTPLDEDSPLLEKLSGQVLAMLNQQQNLREKVTRLSTPSEAERRLQDGQSRTVTDGSPKTPREPRLSARDRGVPDIYLGENGNFRPGMDARYKSDLILSALGLPAPDAKMAFDPADAVARIEERGWTHFLDRKREKMGRA